MTANGSVTKAQLDAGNLVYTPPANANGSTISASFTFKVSDGTSESTSSYTMTVDVTAVNDPATGLPTISGTARVGQELTASKGTIADVDGLPADAAFTWQWLRVDGGSATAITGATSQTYTVVAADAGKKFKVKVSFTDLDGHAEALTSVAYPADRQVSANAAPTGAGKTVTLAEDGSYTFKASDFGFADTDSGDALASVKIVTPPAAGKGSLALDGTAVTANGSVTKAELDAGDLVYTPPANANGSGYASFAFKVSDGTSESASSYTMTVDVTAVNDAATGLPTISGTARVGQELTASKGTIADVDGLPADAAFTWQWLRVDGRSATGITGATSQTYRLAAADAGKKLKVRASFMDLDGHAEELTSAAYPSSGSVGSNAVPTGASKTVTVTEDGSYAFMASDFGFADTDTGDALASVKIVTPPAAGKGSLALDGTAVTANQVIAASDLGKLTYTPPANANGSGYASFAFKVSDGTSESASSYTVTLDVTAVNDAATGLPTISGTARVGQELTASKGTIADDADGLPEVSTFTWQWLRVSGGSDTAISGATSQTYTVVAADAGKKFKVKVSFTDLDGHAEALTSVAYPADRQVSANAAPTGAGETVTLTEDGSYTFKASDFVFADTDTGDALASVKIVTPPAAGKGSLALDGTCGDGEPGDRGFGPWQAHVHAAGEREQFGLCLVRLQGERRDGGERVVLHDDARRDGGERRGDGAADDLGDGACGPGADGVEVSTIADDADGLPADAAFTWQWLRVDRAGAPRRSPGRRRRPTRWWRRTRGRSSR